MLAGFSRDKEPLDVFKLSVMVFHQNIAVGSPRARAGRWIEIRALGSLEPSFDLIQSMGVPDAIKQPEWTASLRMEGS
jgi:hypothetical protein